MLTMTLAEKFGAGNCITDMEFYLLFNRLSILVDVFKTAHLYDGEKRLSHFALAWHISRLNINKTLISEENKYNLNLRNVCRA